MGNNDDLARILETFKLHTNESENDSQPAAKAPPSANDGAGEQQALVAAAVAWLGLLDAGKYPETLATASPLFGKNLTAEGWEQNHALMKKQFGPVTVRDDNVNFTTKTRRTDDGKETVTHTLRIQTTFAKTKGVEKIEMTKESGVWKVSNYSIETKL